MIDVKRPMLLNESLQTVRPLNVENVDLTLNSPGVSQATITLPADEAEPAMHTFLEIYNQKGFVGVFRVSVPTTDYAQRHSIVARHGIDTLADSVFAAQTEFTGTVASFLTQLLSYQTTKVGGTACWQLGTCDDTGTVKYSINYDRLNDLLSKLEEDHDGYYFDYDQTSFPWTLHFRAKPQSVGTEFRRGRNIRTLSRTLNDNDLCTQLILSVNVEKVTTGEYTIPGSGGSASRTETTGETTSTDTAIRTYNNAAAQAIWGIIQRTADIDTHDDIEHEQFPEADAWAQKFLEQHAAPSVQMQIDGDEYFAQTGDTLDETRLNHLCSVPLPEYGQDFTLRIVSVHYPNALADPRHVTASLSTQLPKFSSSISSLKKAEAATAKAARGVGRSAAKAKELTSWSMVVTDQQNALDGTGILQLFESGIDMDAHGGVKIYNLAQGLQSLYSGIEVQAGRINLVVQGEGSSASINIQAIVDGINGSQIDINADRIALNGSTSIADVMEINSGGGLWVKRQAFFGSSNGIVTINNGTVNASTLQVASGGSLTFSGGGQGIYTALTRSKVLDLVTGFGAATESGGQVSIPYYSIGAPSESGASAGSINFNIAATQYYLDHVAAAYGDAVGRVVWPNAPRSQNSFSLSAPTNPWNASTETGTTQSRVFALSNDGQFDATTHITTVNLEMSHSAGGQTVLDGVVATIAIDASAVYTAGQDAAPIQGQITKTYTSNGWKSVIYPDEGYSGISSVLIHVDVPPPAYASSGWGITAAAGGGTKVELYVDGHYFSHNFPDYP